MDLRQKMQVNNFVGYLQKSHKIQRYKTGTRLTGKVTRCKHDGIHVIFEDNVQGILPARLHKDYIPGEDVEVLVLWQNRIGGLLFLQPVGTFEDPEVKLNNDIIGSVVIGEVLYSDPHVTICVLAGGNTLAYVKRFTIFCLPVGSKQKLIVHNVIDNYIICFDMTSLIKFYKNKYLEVPEHIINVFQLKNKKRCSRKRTPIAGEENTQCNENNYGLQSDKQCKRKSEEFLTEENGVFSVTHKKVKNDPLDSNSEEINIVSNKYKQKKKQKWKEIMLHDGINANITNTLKKKEIKRNIHSVAHNRFLVTSITE